MDVSTANNEENLYYQNIINESKKVVLGSKVLSLNFLTNLTFKKVLISKVFRKNIFQLQLKHLENAHKIIGNNNYDYPRLIGIIIFPNY